MSDREVRSAEQARLQYDYDVGSRPVSPARAVLHLIRYSPGSFAVCAAGGIAIYFLLPIPLGLATRAFFDAVSGQTAGLNVWTAIAFIVAVQIGDVLAGIGVTWGAVAVQFKSHALLQHNLFTGILRGYGRDGLPQSPAETISRFRDDPRAFGDALDAICDLIGRLAFAIVAAVLMWRISAVITVAVFVPFLASVFITEALGTKIAAYHAASREATGRLTGFLGDVVAAHLVLKVGGATPRAVNRLADMGDQRRRVSVRNSVFAQALEALNVHLGHLGIGIVLLLGARGIRDGSISVGDFALFVVFLEELTWFPAEIARVISDLKRIRVSLGLMHAAAPGQPQTALVAPAPLPLRGTLRPLPEPPPRQPLKRLEVRGLTAAHGITDVGLSIDRGSFTVVTGRIGSGKSTLLHVLLGLLPSESGEIRWNGQQIDDPARFFVPPQAAFTPQVPRLVSATLRENLLLGLADDEEALDTAVRAAVLEDDVRTLDGGLDTLVGPRGVKLSGGQIQRAAAARMFVRDAELYVFDDLSSALDVQTEAELWRRLFAQGAEVTCLVVSHRPAALRRADQVLLMDAGRVIARGTLEELLASSPQMRQLWHSEQDDRPTV